MRNKSELPSVSIVMPTLNSERTLDECLKSIRSQSYPQEKVEILLVDGGSTDATKQISEAYDCVFIDGGYRENQEARKGVGLHASNGEVVGYIDSDNMLPDKDYLYQMVNPLIEDDSIVGTETMRYGLKKDFKATNRYFALTGVNDPVALYLHKNEKIPWSQEKWDLGEVLEDRDEYVKVRFDAENMPTMGGNGFFVWKELLLKSTCDPEQFFHVDVVLDIVKLGHDTFAMVKNEIYHDTAAKLSSLALRRMKYFNVHNPSHSNRRYLVFNPKSKADLKNLALFMLFTATLVQPIAFSIRGFTKVRDTAWFYHLLVCWSFLFAYTYSTLSVQVRSRLPKNQAY